MPIHEYACKACGSQFEHLLLPAAKTEPVCPACGSRDLEKLMSGFALSTRELTKARVKAARTQMAQSKDHKDKQVAEAEYHKHHIEDHLPPSDTPPRRSK
ncbi:MAG: FmdB family zinc ribbon protein [Vicinamibacterales bacterium]